MSGNFWDETCDYCDQPASVLFRIGKPIAACITHTQEAMNEMLRRRGSVQPLADEAAGSGVRTGVDGFDEQGPVQ